MFTDSEHEYNWDLYNEKVQTYTRELEKIGIQVEDVRAHRRRLTEREMMISPKEYCDYQVNCNQSPVFRCSIDEESAEQIIFMRDRLRHYENEVSALMLKATSQELQLKKIEKLKTILHSHPGIKDQWDEMMVMLKLVGFDETF